MEANLREHWKQLAKEAEALWQEEKNRREQAVVSALEWRSRAQKEETCRAAAVQEAETWKQKAAEEGRLAEEKEKKATPRTPMCLPSAMSIGRMKRLFLE